jgi:hypothetical protein
MVSALQDREVASVQSSSQRRFRFRAGAAFPVGVGKLLLHCRKEGLRTGDAAQVQRQWYKIVVRHRRNHDIELIQLPPRLGASPT